ncbi:MAG: hypothetical protein IBX45_14240 [Campylobacterales bacterium]|nr:hypothetical protein [Campylobacterales bacterium]
MSQVRFGKLARFYIENITDMAKIDEFVEHNGISYQSKLMAEKFANLYDDKFIKLPLHYIETLTLSRAEEVMMSAQEEKNKHGRLKMSKALELSILRNEQDPSKIEVKGTKLFGLAGELKGIKQARDIVKLQAKNNDLTLESVKDGEVVNKYIIHDPEQKINARNLYFAVQGLVKIADKYNEAKTKFYDQKKAGADEATVNASEKEYLRLKIALAFQENLDKYEKWTNETAEKNPDQAQGLYEHFDAYTKEISELESIGYVKIDPAKGTARMTDNDHRNLLVSNADKDLNFLRAGHEKILAEQALRKNKGTQQSEQAPTNDPFKKDAEQPKRASWRDAVGAGDAPQEQKKGGYKKR